MTRLTRLAIGQRGLSLVELMVALAVGLFLLAGALSVFAKTRDLYRTNEQAARLQESARYAMSAIETDLRMASFWGLLNNPVDIRNRPRAPGDVPEGIDTGLAGALNFCGPSWAVDVTNYLEAADADYPLDCPPESGAVAGSDALTVRHASAQTITAAALAGTNGQVKLQTSRSQAELFTGTSIPSEFLPPSSQTRALIVHSYYVDQASDLRPTTPSLRRKRLAFDGAAGVPVTLDEEVIAGVEDLQVQIGWDVNGDQNADFYDDPGAAPAGVPVAVRVWLLVRSETADFSFTDDRTYRYANRADYTPADNFRRLLVSKTIMLRNTRR